MAMHSTEIVKSPKREVNRSILDKQRAQKNESKITDRKSMSKRSEKKGEDERVASNLDDDALLDTNRISCIKQANIESYFETD